MIGAACGFGGVALIAAAAPTLPLELLALIPLGAASVTFAAGINSSLQLAAEPAMRGRVMALYSIVFLGSTPIGGPITGWLSESIDPRAGLVLAGAAGLIAALGAHAALARVRARLPVSSDPRCEPVRIHRPAAAGVDGRRACDRGQVPVSEPA